MTVTWKDYKGPWLGVQHKRWGATTGNSPAALVENSTYSSCCAEEIAARMDWAAEQNAKPPNPTPAEVLQDLAAVGALNALKTPGAAIRQFSTGANRDLDTNKLDYEGFLSPLVLEAFATYMNFNRVLADGSVRDSDNWQKGIPLDVYMKSSYRHFIDFWKAHRGHTVKEGIVWAILGLMFNLQGYLHELLKKDPTLLSRALECAEDRRNEERKAKIYVRPERSFSSKGIVEPGKDYSF